MNDELITVLVGVVAGAIGYLITTFWIKPVMRYRDIRSSILVDLIYYAQVINADGLNDKMKALYEERVLSNRRRSAELSACLLELPHWYKCWLRFCGCAPVEAAKTLIGFSNTTEFDEGNRRIEKIKAALGIKQA